MVRWFNSVLACLLTAHAVAAEDRSRLLGVWKLVSNEVEFQDTGEHRRNFGRKPNGYIIFASDGRMMAYLEAENRKTPQTDEERAAAYDTIVAYTGKYRFEGDKWITKVDGSWNVSWVGTDQVRFFNFDGRYLRVMTPWQPSPVYGKRIVRVVLVGEREE